MAHNDKPKKSNSLSIRLTESAVYLRTDGTPRRMATLPDTRSSMLRGLLILDLVKPTKITSIEVELSATTSTAWPEGIGARRLEVTEEHRVFHATTTYFRPGKSHASRRTASIGPGISYSQQYNHDLLEFNNGNGDLDDDWDEVEWDELQRRLPRMDENIQDAHHSGSRDANSSIETHTHHGPPSFPSFNQPQLASTFYSLNRDDIAPFNPNPPSIPPNTATSRPPLASIRTHMNRRVSVDGTQFQRMPLYETYHEDNEAILAQQLAPIPPYSAFPTSPVSATPATPVSFEVSQLDGQVGHAQSETPAQSLEEFRSSLHSSLRNSQANLSGSAHSLHSIHQQDRSLSRRPSPANIYIPENQELGNTTPRLQSPDRGRHAPTRTPTRSPHPHDTSRSRTRSGRPESLSQPRRYPHSPPPLETQPSGSSSSSSHQHLFQHQQPQAQASGTERGRKGSRFSLSAVSNILMDAVRSGSPRSGNFGTSRERDTHRDREQSVDTIASRRGRTMDRGSAGIDPVAGTVPEEDGSRVRGSKERGRGVIGRILKEKEKQEKVEGWKEFKKGTYTYPISFSIPSNAPPTMQCDFGTVTWRLKANVHRPGAFKPKMSAARDVITIACPTEEDTEDTENIMVERHWEQQLQYLISISGRSFYIGGTMPVTLTLMPLAKVKIHRLSVFIEEKVDYYTNMRRIARTDPVTRFTLLSIKGEGKGDPILPLDSDSPDALRNSPLYALIDPNVTDVELSETASSLMGPGPWAFHQDLQLPKSCDLLRFTNKNRRSNIIVSHMLKVVMRVERGDDVHVDHRTGRRKLFDIVVQTPVLIISCRCNPEWTSLPRYAEVFDDSTTITPSCPCQVSRTRAQDHGPGFRHSSLHMSAALERMTSRQSSESSASAAETSPVNSSAMRSLRHMNANEAILRSSNLFERLISGQESESGEAPPAYEAPSSSRSPIVMLSPAQVVHGNGVAVL